MAGNAKKPYTILTAPGGQIIIQDPEQQLQEALLASEDQAVETLLEVLLGENETAIVSAAKKILTMSWDSEVPYELRAKLVKMQLQAVAALNTVASGGSVATARSEAAGFLVTMQKMAAPANWPPKDTDQRFKDRMEKAEALCAPK